jgi:mannosylglycoprotein endo-beta-mannosidase
VESYYKELFGVEPRGGIELGEGFWGENGRLADEEAQELIKPFTSKELEDALKDMDVNASPGPDGLPVGFYREFWKEIKLVVLEMFQKLYRGELNLSRLNYGMISLIPKIKEANNIRQYRPICLLNVDNKWFSKVFTLRLTPWADKLISRNKTAFIPGRYILEGVVILHEILHELRVKKLQGIILKLDFEKAYDKVRWNFMMEVLRKKNFSGKWVDWMKQIIEGGKVGININGEAGGFFRTHKGLRQGDPLSPFLFNLVSDALSTMLDNARTAGEIKGLMAHLIEGGITHLQYADDTIIFLNMDEQSIIYTKFLLYCFENLSGLKINYQKSEVYVLGCSEGQTAKVAQMFNCNVGQLPMKYLGVMVHNRHMTASELNYVAAKVEKRIPTWQNVGLSSGGKMILVESCLSSVPNYAMGVYAL